MNDDLDDEIIESEEGFDEFSQGSGLSEKIRQNPAMKVGVVVVAVAVIAGVVMMFGGEENKQKNSVLPGGSDVTSVPSTADEIAPAYIEAVEEQNQAVLEEAIQTGQSAIPVPIDTPDTRLEVPEVEQEEEDPLHRWRALQEERVKREMKTRETAEEPVTVLDAEQQNEAINELAESMASQMESVLGANTEEKTFTTKTLISYEASNAAGTASAGAAGGGGPQSASPFEDLNEEVVVVSAGTIVYGQLLLEANSDVESTVLAQMVSGPLKGWKLLGEFTVMEDINMLAITFSTAVNDEGKQHDIEAIMLDPDSTLAAMRSDINHRYLQRIIFPAAAAFIDGFAQAIAESGRTSVTVSGETVIEEEEEKSDDQEVATGVEEAASEVREILDEMGDVPVQIIIEAGTPIGIFFTDNVVEDEGDI